MKARALRTGALVRMGQRSCPARARFGGAGPPRGDERGSGRLEKAGPVCHCRTLPFKLGACLAPAHCPAGYGTHTHTNPPPPAAADTAALGRLAPAHCPAVALRDAAAALGPAGQHGGRLGVVDREVPRSAAPARGGRGAARRGKNDPVRDSGAPFRAVGKLGRDEFFRRERDASGMGGWRVAGGPARRACPDFITDFIDFIARNSSSGSGGSCGGLEAPRPLELRGARLERRRSPGTVRRMKQSTHRLALPWWRIDSFRGCLAQPPVRAGAVRVEGGALRGRARPVRCSGLGAPSFSSLGPGKADARAGRFCGATRGPRHLVASRGRVRAFAVCSVGSCCCVPNSHTSNM